MTKKKYSIYNRKWDMYFPIYYSHPAPGHLHPILLLRTVPTESRYHDQPQFYGIFRNHISNLLLHTVQTESRYHDQPQFYGIFRNHISNLLLRMVQTESRYHDQPQFSGIFRNHISNLLLRMVQTESRYHDQPQFSGIFWHLRPILPLPDKITVRTFPEVNFNTFPEKVKISPFASLSIPIRNPLPRSANTPKFRAHLPCLP
jgi:hypothetical protein